MVRVIIPPTDSRPHAVDLLLCGHHYLASRAALVAIGAVAIDKAGEVVEPASANVQTLGRVPADSVSVR